jgi:hypothetical protein
VLLLAGTTADMSQFDRDCRRKFKATLSWDP